MLGLIILFCSMFFFESESINENIENRKHALLLLFCYLLQKHDSLKF